MLDQASAQFAASALVTADQLLALKTKEELALGGGVNGVLSPSGKTTYRITQAGTAFTKWCNYFSSISSLTCELRFILTTLAVESLMESTVRDDNCVSRWNKTCRSKPQQAAHCRQQGVGHSCVKIKS